MYNKLFTSILDSSIWLESTATRIVWVTLLAAMDEDGFVRMATALNLAGRARVTVEECLEALKALESPDTHCPEQEHQGRRIERVDGGWMVLNSVKYRDIVSREQIKQQTRIRVARCRANKSGNAPVTVCNENVTPSEADTDTRSDTEVRGASLSLPIKILFEAWNRTASDIKLKNCLIVSDKRRRTIEARFRDPFFSANWSSALQKLSSSDFCRGNNERGWVASFDWFIQPDSVAKIMEGKYDNKTRQRTNPRLEGVSRNPINDYGAASAARKQQQQAEQRRLEAQMASAGNQPPQAPAS